MTRRVLYFTAPFTLAVKEEPLPPPAPGRVLVQTQLSAISGGTELLIYRGLAPPDLAADETLPALTGSFTFPLKYGYACVGEVISLGPGVDQDWLGRTVFAFNSHESHFWAAPENLAPVPGDLAPEEAIFLANMETAVTLVLDGAPRVGEQVAVFGQGVVGLLTGAILARLPLTSLVTLDLHPRRRLASETLGAHVSLDPAAPGALSLLISKLQGPSPYAGADLCFELSGNPEALNLALAATGFSGRVVIGSWYGRKKGEIDLGGAFHRRRIRLISSQVSTIAPELTGRFTKARRFQIAWEMLRQVRPSRLITHRVPLTRAPQAYETLDKNPQDAIQVALTY
jgi:2-desacetyl-2-hydroxyethyl bacteriochlorophyllide A dehydrogenase